eukprot:scaffold6944_cov118-Isochrysis_galbana.AAC.5
MPSSNLQRLRSLSYRTCKKIIWHGGWWGSGRGPAARASAGAEARRGRVAPPAPPASSQQPALKKNVRERLEKSLLVAVLAIAPPQLRPIHMRVGARSSERRPEAEAAPTPAGCCKNAFRLPRSHRGAPQSRRRSQSTTHCHVRSSRHAF